MTDATGPLTRKHCTDLNPPTSPCTWTPATTAAGAAVMTSRLPTTTYCDGTHLPAVYAPAECRSASA